jgi:tetratricopeptide (TPR) repeat protein
MKFKNIKKDPRKKAPAKKSPAKKVGNSGKKPQFPNIYRIITERGVFKIPLKSTFRLSLKPKLNKFLVIFAAMTALVVIVVSAVGIAFFSVKVYQNYQEITQINAQRQQIQSKINFWQSIADKYEGFKDAYFQMAILDYNLGNFQKAKLENVKALTLDPNFNDAKNLEEVLNNK